MLSYLIGLLLSWTVVALSPRLNPEPVIWIPYGIINPILFSLPRFAHTTIPAIRTRLNARAVSRIEWVGALIILLNAPGSLVLHDMGIHYDRFLHFSVGAVVIFLVIPIIAAIRGRGADLSKTLFVSVILVFIGLFCFEGVQFSSDQLFGTHLFHDEIQSIERDVTEDIIFGSLGLALSLLGIMRSKRLREATFLRED